MGASVPARPRPRVGAFFDMDKTLICENSGSLYMQHRYEKGELSAVELAKGAVAYLRYKVGMLDIRAWTAGMVEQFRGESEELLEDEAREWCRDVVIDKLYPEAVEIVRWHLDQDHVVAIVSGSMRFVVEPLAEHLSIPHILYTRMEVAGGRFTGRVIDPVCFEEGKIHWLRELVDEQRIELAKSFFYTDSITDLPLLELVGHPVVTNPDPRLYREAVRRGWPVRLFEPPDPAPETGRR
ncbi:MAG: HAD family hydrolase [Myxococcota bacterium]|nr:HAD family hydrolase [Myxococcota bacterium]